MPLDPRLVAVNINRLRRNYDDAVLRCDEAVLLDLAVSLRNWVEMSSELRTLSSSFKESKVFETRASNSHVQKVLREGRQVVAFLPGGVITRAVQGVLLHYPMPPEGGTSVGGFQVQQKSDGSIEVRALCWADTEDFRALDAALQTCPLKRFAFKEWLGAEVVRVRYLDEEGSAQMRTFDRATLIKRVTNTLGGAHPPGVREDGEAHTYDAALAFLQQFWVNGATLPYFILLKIAKEILDRAPSLLAAPAKQSGT